MAKYLVFQWAGRSKSGKTLVYKVLNKHHGDELGQIKWLAEWRQYCFVPAQASMEAQTRHGWKPELLYFSAGCLDDISSFLKSLMAQRKVPKPWDGNPDSAP